MDWQLDGAEARVLGALLEKEIAKAISAPMSNQMRGVNLPVFFLDLFLAGMADLS